MVSSSNESGYVGIHIHDELVKDVLELVSASVFHALDA